LALLDFPAKRGFRVMLRRRRAGRDMPVGLLL